MKFRAHETFFIRKGWLTKGMKYIQTDPYVFVSRERNPMDVIGVGANMVKSLRYWLLVTGLSSEPARGRKSQTLTPLGEQVYEHDRYIEEFGTLCLLQYEIANNKENATSWWYFFNEFQHAEFNKEDFVKSLNDRVTVQGESVALRSLGDDFTCIVGTYLPRYKVKKDVSPENNIDCPLGEIGLLDIVDKEKKIYKKSCPPSSSFDPWIILSFIMRQAGKKTEIGLNSLLIDAGSIGKVFNLDIITLIDVLRKAERTGYVKIIRTAGLDVVRIIEHIEPLECIKNYYKNLGA